MSPRGGSFQQPGVEKGPQLRSRIVQTLNVPRRVRLGPSLAAALLGGLFEHPTGCLVPWATRMTLRSHASSRTALQFGTAEHRGPARLGQARSVWLSGLSGPSG